jgi:photosystem II stability/assembly factor-like uncharacterized protein
MTIAPSRRVAALLSLLIALVAAGFPAGLAQAANPAPPAASDLTAVDPQATIPGTGHIRFFRVGDRGRLLFVGLADGGLERSANGGRSWQDLRLGVAGGPGAQMLDLQIAPSDPRVVWAAGLSGVYRSTDGGITWTEADTRGDMPGRALGSVLAIDPRHPEAAYLAGYCNGGLFRTADGGLSWQEVLDYPVSGVAIEPANGAIVYALSRTAGFQRSDDHGHAWSAGVFLPAYTGIGQETSLAGRLLALDGPDGGIYAAMDGGGLERSVDGGRAWQDLALGLPRSQPGAGLTVPYDLALGSDGLPRLYTIVPNGTAAGGDLYAATLPAAHAAALTGALAAVPPWTTAISTGLPSSSTTSTASPTPSPTMTGTLTPSSTPTTIPSTSPTPSPGRSRTPSHTPTASPTHTGTATRTSSLTPTLTPSPTVTPLPLLHWQRVMSNVDAIAMPALDPGNLAVASEVSPLHGFAVVHWLGGALLYRLGYRQRPPLAHIIGDSFAYGLTVVPYLSGINYEGPADRPWQMWEDGKWDPSLIASDFDAAAATGYKVLRIFVQDPLTGQILAGQFGHLDTVVALARQRDLRLLITFNDSHDLAMTRVTAVERALGAHLAGNPTIFGYDLQNEPGVQEIVGAIYPPGTSVALDSPALFKRYGQTISLAAVRAQRAAGQWRDAPFTEMSDTQVYDYLNAATILDDFLSANPNYPETAPADSWLPLLAAANQTLATFINVQMQALRAVDPAHLITLGYNSPFWSSFSANEALSFRSIHLYPTSLNWAAIHNSLHYFEDLKGIAQTPLVLGEYGFSTAFQAGSVASVQETAMSLYLRVIGGAGDLKWVLNDDTVGYNPYENGLGLFGAGGAAKPGFYVMRELNAYFAGPHQPGGARMETAGATGVTYLYSAPDALGVSGGSYSDARLSYVAHADDPSAQLWLDWAEPGRLRFVSTDEADLSIDLPALTGALSGTITLAPAQSSTYDGQTLRLHLQAGIWYTVLFPPGPADPPPPLDLPTAAQSQGWYILTTGHNILPPFLQLWLNLGGIPMAGSPIDDAQQEGDSKVQYFDNLAMSARGRTVTLLPLGLAAIGGTPAPPAPALPRNTPHLYFRQTGHNLSGRFLTFWQSSGGLAFWGPPVTEPRTIGHQITVQYFTNAAYVWNGSTVSLAPIGDSAWTHPAG